MTVIRVNPQSVTKYGEDAGQKFSHCRTELEKLVNEAVGVRYFGENAVQFKQKAGQMSAQFSTELLKFFQEIATAVQQTTSNIANALGGGPVQIAVNGAAIQAPPVQPSDFYDVDTTALTQLKTTVTNHLNAVQMALDENLTSLKGTDWEGTAKESAVVAVTTLTTKAKDAAKRAETEINKFVDTQIDAVTKADV